MARLLLQALTPGTSYYVQFRAVEGDSTSDWSRRLTLATSADVTPPDVPAWAASNFWVVDGDTFVATWQALNFTLDQNVDFDHYEITLSDGTVSATVRTLNTSYTLTFEQNRIFFGSPKATVTAKVRSVDAVGNASAYGTTESATNPAPSAVASLVVTPLYDSIKVDWATVADIDVVSYRVDVSTTSSSSGYSTVYTGANNSFVHNTTAFNTDHWYRVYAVDKFGTVSSPTTSGAVRPKSTLTLDTTPPSNATLFNGTGGWDAASQNGYVDLAWTASVSTDVGRYEIRYGTNGSNWDYLSVGGDQTGFRLRNLASNIPYYFAIRAVDFSGNTSSWLNATTYPLNSGIDAAAPSTPSQPTVSVDTQKIQVALDGLNNAAGPMEADVSYYEVFASTTSGFTTYNSTTMLGTIQDGPALIETFNIPASAGSGTTQTWYVKVRAVDYTGNVSPASAQATGAVGLIATANIGDAQITNAKINDLAVNKLTAGTGIINALTVKNTLTIGDATTAGSVQSFNYAAGTAGFKIASTAAGAASLEINEGTIRAAALAIQMGNNMMKAKWADFEFLPALYPTNLNSGTLVTTTIDSTKQKYNSQSLKIVSTAGAARTFYFGESTTDYNIALEASTRYIVSYYVWNDTGSSVNGYMGIKQQDATVVNGGLTAFANTAAWVRYTNVVTTTSAATAALATFTINNSGTFYVDGIQFERAFNATQSTASQWQPPGYTTIDGAQIKTGSIESTADALDVNGNPISGVKKWSINAAGGAIFGDMLIRGKFVMGLAGAEDTVTAGTGAEDSTNGVSQMSSYNYSPGIAGWAIRSNGVAEFLQLKAGTIDGGAIATGSFTADKLGPGTIGADIFMGAQFRAIESQTLVLTNKSLTSNVATVTTSDSHNRVVGDRIRVAFDTPDATFDTPSNSFDTVTAVTSTTLSYARTASNVSSTADTGSVYIEGRSVAISPSGVTLYDNDAISIVVQLPTNPAQEAYFAGAINASSLIVKNNLAIRGSNNTVDAGSTLTLNAAIVAPSQAAVTTAWNSISTWLTSGNTRYGLWYDGTNYKTLNSFFGAQALSYGDLGAFAGNDSLDGTSNTALPLGGLCKIGSNYYALVWNYSNNLWRVFKYDSTGTGFSSNLSGSNFTYDVKANAAYNATATEWKSTASGGTLKDPAIGTDGTDIYIARCNAAGRIAVAKYTTAGSLTSVTQTNITDNQQIKSINVGSFDYGATRWIISTKGNSTKASQNYSTNTSGTHQTAETFPTPYSVKQFGTMWNSTLSQFVTLGENNRHYYYTSVAKNGSSAWSVKSTWHDNDTSTVAVSNKVADGATATLTVPTGHGYVTGDVVVVAGVDATFNGTYTLTGTTTTTVSYDLVATVSSQSATGTVGTNEYETAMSSALAFTVTRRARLTVSTNQSVPDTGRHNDPDRARFYMSNTGSSGTHWRQSTLSEGVTTLTFTADPTFSGTSTTGTAFPSGSPAKIVSSNNLIIISSDGSITAPKKMQTGIKNTGTFSAVNTDKTVTLTFPTAFDVIPHVIAIPNASSSQNVRYPVVVTNITKTACDLTASRAVGTGAFDMEWIAMTS